MLFSLLIGGLMLMMFVAIFICWGISYSTEFPNGNNSLLSGDSHNAAMMATLCLTLIGWVFWMIYTWQLGQWSEFWGWWR